MAIEKIEVVGYIYGRMLSHPEFIEDEGDIPPDQKLMTVAQHERIVAALSQQAEPVEPAPAQDEREAFEEWVKTFNNMPAALFRDERDRYLDDWIQCRWMGWQAALATRSAQPEHKPVEQHTQWISVAERLPENRAGVFYLAVNTAGYMDKISRITKCKQPADVAPITTYSGWLDEHGRTDCTVGSVTHWMPLPSPPTP